MSDKLEEAVRALIVAVTYADPPVLFNGVLCHEARIPVEFVKDVRDHLPPKDRTPTPEKVESDGWERGMKEAANICGSLAETTYDDADAFEAAVGCEAAIMSNLDMHQRNRASTPPAADAH